ncbi:MAG: DoxX family protein [Aridibacter famidurans]|nr:DoxX family protein [Aridibacter famidurans]
MVPLVVLLVAFFVLFAIDRAVIKGKLGLSMTGRGAMAAMLLVTTIAHFTSTEAMVQMMPEAMPYKREVVWLTGACEFAAVIGLLWPRVVRLTSVLLIVFFVAVLPANIAGSLKSEGIGGTSYGPWYLLFRVPLQIFFIAWVWYFGLRKNKQDGQD